MYLAKLKILNFRKIKSIEIHFQDGLNVIVGANNVGKSTVVDALRALLAGHEEPYPRFDVDDLHRSSKNSGASEINFHYVFRGLDFDDEAELLKALVPDSDGNLEAHFSVCYFNADPSGRFRVKRWCGLHEGVSLTSEMAECLRCVYLPPLRDASQGLRPSRTSQLSRLFRLLSDKSGQEGINAALSKLDADLKGHAPVVQTHGKINGRYRAMLGAQLTQSLDVALSPNDFHRLASRLSLVVDSFEIDQNGLGFNNLLYMAVVLSELTVNPDACYRSLVVEEPESHLHPQLQAILLQYLESVHRTVDEKPVQLFLTSHSPHFASIADLGSLICLVDTSDGVQVFCPRDAKFGKHKREKLQRYLDVTRAELFFARRIIFVEGAAELMLVSVLAKKVGVSLREHGVSLISVEGLNFDCFLPLFGEKGLRIPVSVITDADPKDCMEGGESSDNLSGNVNKLQGWEDSFVKVFHGSKTLEYDLALYEDNRKSMLDALQELSPAICNKVRLEVDSACENEEKADALYSGLFKTRGVLKGRFAQSLAQVLSERDSEFHVPKYIDDAIKHACRSEVSNA